MTKGRCNICQKVRALTRDHVPPKGCVTIDIREARNLTKYLARDGKPGYKVWSSVNFLTICGCCNNNRLGREYDPELKTFCERVATWIRTQYTHNLTLPSRFRVKCKPQRLLRAIIGHLLAAEPRAEPWEPVVSTPMLDSYRRYFLDTNLSPPEELRVYCWPYPSQKQVIIRSAGIQKYGKEVITSAFLKFFPTGFWLTWEQPDSVSISLSDITPKPACALDDIREVEIRLDLVPPIDWPEHPHKHETLFIYDQHMVIAE